MLKIDFGRTFTTEWNIKLPITENMQSTDSTQLNYNSQMMTYSIQRMMNATIIHQIYKANGKSTKYELEFQFAASMPKQEEKTDNNLTFQNISHCFSLIIQLKYSKSYNDTEDKFRKTIYSINKAIIEEHNRYAEAGLISYKLLIDNYADFLDDELPSKEWILFYQLLLLFIHVMLANFLNNNCWFRNKSKRVVQIFTLQFQSISHWELTAQIRIMVWIMCKHWSLSLILISVSTCWVAMIVPSCCASVQLLEFMQPTDAAHNPDDGVLCISKVRNHFNKKNVNKINDNFLCVVSLRFVSVSE